MDLGEIGKFIDLCQFPAQEPPDGIESNFHNPQSLQSTTIGLGVTVTAVAAILTVARIYINALKLHVADYFVVTGTILSIAYTALTISYSKYARHQWDVPACWFNGNYLKLLYCSLTFSGPTAFFPKSAILLIYLQFFSIHKAMRIAVYIGLFATAATYLPSIIVAACLGAPRPGQTWTSLYTTKRLYHEAYYGMVVGVLAVALDIYIFILPMPILWRLHMDRSRRFQLFGVFGTAFIGVAASVVALVYRVRILNLVDRADDATWIQFCNFIAGIIEVNIAIIVGCMPAFAGFMRHRISGSTMFQSLRIKMSKSGSDGSSSRTPRWPSRDTQQGLGSEIHGSNIPQLDYYELEERPRPILTTGPRIHGGGYPHPQPGNYGILRQTEITQYTSSNSSDALV